MTRSIDLRMAQPFNMDNPKFEKVLGIVERELEKGFPNALIRVRKSTSITELQVFGFGKEGKAEVDAFLEELFTNSFLFEDL